MALIKARSRGINLADNFAFTGTVSGAGGTVDDGTNTLSKVAFHRWKINSAFTASTGVNDITGTFDQQYAVGTAMSYSSGIWTFPYTGQWHITLNIVGSNTGSSTYRGGLIKTTTNNSSYGQAIGSYTGQDGSHYYNSHYNSIFFDVTDVSTHKVKFSTEMQNSGGVSSSTWCEFFYLGDT